MSKAIVLANGEIAQPDVIKARLDAWRNPDTLVIAADGGSRHAHTLGLSLDAIVGDFDSVDAAQRAQFEAEGTRFETFSAEKDETDLELALYYALDQGRTTIVGIGWLAGRLDMTLANLLLLAHPSLLKADIQVWSGAQTAWVIRPPGGTVTGDAGDMLSLIPLAGDARGVSAQHVEYPLDGETLALGPARGVSNVLQAPQALIELREGLLLAIHTPESAANVHGARKDRENDG